MRSVFRAIRALVILGGIAILGLIFIPESRTPPVKSLAPDFQSLKGSGAVVEHAADCAGCHTAPGGMPFAGGRGIESPFGVIYATNITPDRQFGIGTYSLDEFRAALYDGVRKDGTHLYPAMPYANYRKITEEDVRALYAYFRGEVAAVPQAAPKTRLGFPFNQRWGIRAWNWVALPKAGFTAHLGDEKLDRGAYLVEAAGHCGACHTPRNLLFAERGYDSSSPDFLTGAMLGSWPAADLRARDSAAQRWSDTEVADLLSSGRNATKAVGGEMAVAIEHSLQYLPKYDLEAIVAYLKAIKQDRSSTAAGTQRKEAQPTAAILAGASPQMSLGARLYLDNCNACHFVDGRGAPGVFPSLDRNDLVTAVAPDGLITVILDGTAMPSTERRPERLKMPGFGKRLSDAEVATLATFVREAWSNNASPVTEAQAITARRNSASAPAH
jgi:alcohol dehydrogenase (quinone), cytochrome c subunit